MTVEEQIKLARQDAFFRPVMVKALNRACEEILTVFQPEAARTKLIHDKLYAYALNFSKTCFVSDAVFASCISNLLDDATYVDPEHEPDNATSALYAVILADYTASFIQGGASVYPSWIERIAGYTLDDEGLNA